ncbi:SlyX family protein [Roseovarius autotrophicus]|uniref:SlyX family protein n=1 Tax=Roseovarius autotrophicus TaxID=2824121 RepID=UPI0019E813E9|nr:SlyX family protein [Roseovarius autotrophicus]MBE0453550.1 SlyX family protein [Roseovarius sp.]
MTEIEERLAHLIRAVDDLSEVVARQDREIERLRTAVALLTRREAERAREGEGGIVLGDERPPHY